MSQPQYGPPQPAWGPPPPKKGMNGCAIAAIIGAAIVGLVILLGIIVAVFSSSDTAAPKPRQTSSAPAKTTPSSNAPAKTEPPAASPVKVTAKATVFAPSVLHDGTTAYTSVKVTVTNGGKKPISINPLYFTITDTNGSKHTAELGMDENQIATVDLAPGENITGVITGKGKFTAAYVTYTDGLFGDGIRGTVG